MIKRMLAVGAMAMVSAHVLPASATVYYDTATGIIPTSYDGVYTINNDVNITTVMADSFSAPTANFGYVALSLSALNPSDGGSFSVYLVPDNGSNAPTGITGSAPTINTTGYYLLGTVLDSSLPSTSYASVHGGPGNGGGTTLTSFTFSPSSIPASTDNEYWIVLDNLGGSSSVDWYYNSDDSGIGVTGQYVGNNGADSPQTQNTPDWGVSPASSLAPYQLIVSTEAPIPTPEPTTIAILGLGLAGLGLSRFGKVA